jgi:hypothetical protein
MNVLLKLVDSQLYIIKSIKDDEIGKYELYQMNRTPITYGGVGWYIIQIDILTF